MISPFGKFKEIVEKNKKGIFVLNSWDNLVPEGVRTYCQKNLEKRVFKIDQLYPLRP